MPNKKLMELVDYKINEVERYYFFILLNLGLKIYLDDRKKLNCRYVGCEIKIKRSSSDGRDLPEVNPDIILQSSSKDVIGFPIEVKSSISNDENITEELKKMKRYDQPLYGWATESRTVSDHKIVFCPSLEDSTRVKQILKELIDRHELQFDKQFLIWEWGITKSFKLAKEDVILLRHVYGDMVDSDLTEFDKELKTGISIDTTGEKISTFKELVRFTRKKPPLEHSMIELWMSILPRFCTEMNDFTTDVNTVVNFLNSIESPLMINTDGHKFVIRKDWIREAFEKFVSINLANNLGDDKYRFQLQERMRDVKKYICKATAKVDLRAYREKGQKPLET